ncbi:unnamed protein product [Prorocentrum cordatum]|uniref:Uncharacterized protein n=1 Tax=Prorocentrum cordatum TaxID=2364126 RepID=A0ABN9PPQ7_9DINO|nr:unnamed protein product [Polarella glacialis]
MRRRSSRVAEPMCDVTITFSMRGQRVVARERLRGRHIEGRGTNRAVPQRGDQGDDVLYDDVPARNIHEGRGSLHEPQLTGADHPPGLLGGGDAERDEVADLEQLVQAPIAPGWGSISWKVFAGSVTLRTIRQDSGTIKLENAKVRRDWPR